MAKRKHKRTPKAVRVSQLESGIFGAPRRFGSGPPAIGSRVTWVSKDQSLRILRNMKDLTAGNPALPASNGRAGLSKGQPFAQRDPETRCSPINPAKPGRDRRA
jgi:hypothetical protein